MASCWMGPAELFFVLIVWAWVGLGWVGLGWALFFYHVWFPKLPRVRLSCYSPKSAHARADTCAHMRRAHRHEKRAHTSAHKRPKTRKGAQTSTHTTPNMRLGEKTHLKAKVEKGTVECTLQWWRYITL